MADSPRPAGLERPDTVSALGLRWAALRGMLASPLIEAEEQQGLRDELVRELGVLERDFATVAARSPVEFAAKIDVAKAGLRQAGLAADDWIVQLLDSLKADVRSFAGLGAARPSPMLRPVGNGEPDSPQASTPDEAAE